MKQFVAILSFVFLGLTDAHAQTFLEDIQKQEAGQGTVTVKESSDIDDLVNGKTPINVAPPKENKVQTQAKVEVPHKDNVSKDKDNGLRAGGDGGNGFCGRYYPPGGIR